MKHPLIFIVGPTATGKTDTALALAQKISADIISCDSMLIYKEPQILVNKPPAQILKKVRHYMVNIVSVEETYDVYRFKKTVDEIIKENYRKRNLIFSGGSGLYVKAVLDGIFEGTEPLPRLRENLLKVAEEKGTAFLYEELKKLDIKICEKIKPQDQRRIIRALEVCYTAKKPLSEKQKEARGWRQKLPLCIFGLKLDRNLLYKKIEERTDLMLKLGLVDEVGRLLKYNLSKTAEKILGLKEIKAYLDKSCSLDQAVGELKKNTRRFAKRQYTWFNKDKQIKWIDIQNKNAREISEEILSEING